MPETQRVSQFDDPWEAPDPALALALQQIQWYAVHRNQARRIYQVNELLILLASASTTVAAALKASAWVTASSRDVAALAELPICVVDTR